jgi:hypothetical protein
MAGVLAVTLSSCGSPTDAPLPAHIVAHRPPTRKDIIEAVLASQAVKLTVHPSCQDVGSEKTDTTIGGYLSGFLAELGNQDETNWLETKVEPARTAAGVPVWRAELMVRHSAKEDEWGWGVRFDVRQDDQTVVPQSFMCVGAG